MPRQRLLSLIAICLATAVAYGGTVANGFTFDDHGIVAGNAALADLDLGQLCRGSYWSATGANTGLYRPVTLVSLALNRWALGPGPGGYHLVNLALHAAMAALLCALATRALGPPAGLLAGLVLATHPVLSESVNAVVGRADLLGGVLSLVAVCLLWPLSRAVGLWRALGAGVVLVAAQLSKESGVIAAAALALTALAHARPIRRLWLVPALAAAAATAMRLAATGLLRPAGIGFIDNPLAYVDLWGRLANGATIAVRYLHLIAHPWPLSADYSYAQIPLAAPQSPEVIVAAAFALSLAVVSARLARGTPVALLAWGLAVAGLAMASHLVAPLGTVFAERLAAVPVVAFSLACGWALARLWGARRLPALLMVGVWLVVAAALSSARTRDWQSDMTLFNAAVITCPNSARAHYGLGRALHEQGQLEAAVAAYDRSVSIYPRYTEAHYNRGAALVALDRGSEALAAYERALSCRPGDRRALVAAAVLTEHLHGMDRARSLYERVLQMDPGHERAAARLAAHLAGAGDAAGALRVLDAALGARPAPRLVTLRRVLARAPADPLQLGGTPPAPRPTP